jgi:hypothetical protein
MRRLFFLFSFFLFFALVGILKQTYAQGGCTQDPTWVSLGHTDGAHSVTYHFRLINNCPGSNNFNIRVSDLPNSPRTLHADWRVERENGTLGGLNETITRSVNGSERIDIRVIRDLDYYHPNGTYYYVTFRAALVSNTSVNDTITEAYIVVNRPELEITAFNFPGGNTCNTSDVRIRIRNHGWVSATSNFTVRVNNGRGDTNTRRVTQTVSHNETLNLDQYFRNMARPPVGNWTAVATVDVNNEVTEEDEGNNDAEDRYTTTPCTVSPPPTTVTITPPPVTVTVTPTPASSANAWVQSVGGDIREDRGRSFQTNIITAANEFFSQASTLFSHGVVFLSGTFNLGNPSDQSTKANSSTWLVTNIEYNPANTINTSYSEVVKNLTRGGVMKNAINLFGGSTSPCRNNFGPSCNLDPNLGGGVYFSDGNVTLNQVTPRYEFNTNSDYIFLINGNLNIFSNLFVPKGSTAVFIVEGEINIGPDVTSIDGIFSADEKFVVEGSDNQLIINGNVIANARRQNIQPFENSRDLGSGNATRPAVQVIMRPDFILNVPQLIRTGNFDRKEVAPGQ